MLHEYGMAQLLYAFDFQNVCCHAIWHNLNLVVGHTSLKE